MLFNLSQWMLSMLHEMYSKEDDQENYECLSQIMKSRMDENIISDLCTVCAQGWKFIHITNVTFVF